MCNQWFAVHWIANIWKTGNDFQQAADFLSPIFADCHVTVADSPQLLEASALGSLIAACPAWKRESPQLSP